MSGRPWLRWFGLGRIPKAMLPILRKEGIRLQDEGVLGSVTLRHFRAPGRYSRWRRSLVIGCE